MSKRTWHSHPCADCGTVVWCADEYEENHDGLTSVFCPRCDARGHEPLCEDCDDARKRASWEEAIVEHE